MSEYDAIAILRRQFEVHLQALDAAETDAEKAALTRNLAKQFKTWGKTLDKQAAHHESMAMIRVKAKFPGLEAA